MSRINLDPAPADIAQDAEYDPGVGREFLIHNSNLCLAFRACHGVTILSHFIETVIWLYQAA